MGDFSAILAVSALSMLAITIGIVYLLIVSLIPKLFLIVGTIAFFLATIVSFFLFGHWSNLCQRTYVRIF
jgi:hypothetical protein